MGLQGMHQAACGRGAAMAMRGMQRMEREGKFPGALHAATMHVLSHLHDM